jgi:AcrR family transcriptional regulator
VTFRSVAAEAGVTHGLASYHFGTRERMIVEALEWASQRAITLTHLGVAVDRLEDLGTATPQVIANAPDEAAFQFQLALEALRRPELRAGVRASYDAYVSAVQQSLDSVGLDGDPALGRLVFAALDGVALQQLIFDDELRSSASIDALHALLDAFSASTRR